MRTPMRVIQLLPTLAFGDAVGNDARAIADLLASRDYETAIYAENIDPRLPEGSAFPAEDLPALKKNDVLIYHLSTGTALNDRVAGIPCRRVMIYHNITPPAFFAPYNPEAELLCMEGLQGMTRLRNAFDYVLAVSEYNKENLRTAGYVCPIDVRPVLIPWEDYDRAPDEKTLKKYSDGRTNILFVGRITPNKKQEDVIRAFTLYKKQYDPGARLILAGSAGNMEKYKKCLEDYAALLGERDVIFTGHIGFGQLLALYRTADVFLCMSEHEGFCVPLTEAMYFNVPVIARRSGAVPLTLGGAGILLEDGDPAAAAAAIRRVMTDAGFKSTVLARQRERLKAFSYESVSRLFLEQLDAFLEGRCGK